MAQLTPEMLRILNSYYIRLPSNLGATVERGDGQDQEIADSTWDQVDWLNELEDTGSTGVGGSYPNGIWNAVPNPARLTAVKSGWWAADAHIAWEENAAGWRAIALQHSGGAPLVRFEVNYNPVPIGWVLFQNVTGTFWMDEGQWLDILVHQTSGGPLDILGAFSSFTMVRVP